jgi:hypothetical protein
VTLNNDGTLTGFAWSDNVGWVQFGGLSGFPIGAGTVAANAQADLSTGAVTGWVRAITATTTETLGWDGWISLSGTLYTSPNFAGTGGMTYSSTTGWFTGYAWGSDVVGWVSFASSPVTTLNAPVITPTCSLNASSNTLSSPSQHVTLSWSSTNAASCSLEDSVASQYSTATSSSGLTLTPGVSINYILQCTSITAASCQANQNVSVTQSSTSLAVNKIWLNNDSLKLLTNATIRSNRAAVVNWDVADVSDLGYTACTENVTSANWTGTSTWSQGGALPSLRALNNTTQARTLSGLSEGSHVLSITCTDPTNTLSPVSTTTDSVKITVLPASINEQ